MSLNFLLEISWWGIRTVLRVLGMEHLVGKNRRRDEGSFYFAVSALYNVFSAAEPCFHPMIGFKNMKLNDGGWLRTIPGSINGFVNPWNFLPW